MHPDCFQPFPHNILSFYYRLVRRKKQPVKPDYSLYPFQKAARRELQALAASFFHTFNQELESITGHSYIQQNIGIQDLYRTLIFRYWMERYSVSLEFIIKTVIGFWLLKKPHDGKIGLGLGLATLTGEVSEQILQKNIQIHYPNNENVQEKKHRKRNSMLIEVIHDTAVPSDLENFVSEYRKSIQKSMGVRLTQEACHRVRHYRGNPFF
jgi:hypothetical protein